MREKVVTHQVRIDDRIFRDLAKLSAETGLRSAVNQRAKVTRLGGGNSVKTDHLMSWNQPLWIGNLRLIPGAGRGMLFDDPKP